jgi:hypothetical protein
MPFFQLTGVFKMEKENENQDHVTIEETAAECIERLRAELAESERVSNIRQVELKRLSERIDNIEEEALIAFGRIPYLMQWVENIVEDYVNMKLDDYMDSHDTEKVIDERIDDAELVSQREIENMIEFAIDEAKEEGQEIAKDSIQEMIDATLNNATFDTSIRL